MTWPLSVTVTGADGFVGAWVVPLLRARGHEVTCVVDAAADCPDADTVLVVDPARGFPPAALGDVVIHLAGWSAVGPSFDRPQGYLEHNSVWVTALCEAMMVSGGHTRALIASSAAVYGAGGTGAALTESSPFLPASPYAVSKVVVEHQVGYYRRRGLDLRVLRPFNSLGPGQPRGFLVADLMAKVAALAPGQPLITGPLNAVRDFTDVRDIARAYVDVAVAPSTPHDVYNVASGQPVPISRMLELICEVVGRPVPELAINDDLARAGDPSRVLGDPSLLRADLGWEPRIPLARSLLDYRNSLEGS